MTTSIETVADSIQITGEMTVYTAAQIKQLLVDAIADGPATIQLDLSGVPEFDTAGLQLLLLAQREALARGRSFRLKSESLVVREVLALCGVRGLLPGATPAEDRQ